MAIIGFKDSGKGISATRSYDGMKTLLEGTNGYELIMLVSDDVLLELDHNGVEYDQIEEKNIKDYLEPDVFSKYQTLKESYSGQINFDRELPPHGYLEGAIHIQENDIDRAKDVLGRYDTLEVKLKESAIGLSIHDLSEENKVIEFYVNKEDLDDVVDALSSERIAGYDRAHQVYFSDPDSKI